jgi:hypothetical protein
LKSLNLPVDDVVHALPMLSAMVHSQKGTVKRDERNVICGDFTDYAKELGFAGASGAPWGRTRTIVLGTWGPNLRPQVPILSFRLCAQVKK